MGAHLCSTLNYIVLLRADINLSSSARAIAIASVPLNESFERCSELIPKVRMSSIYIVSDLLYQMVINILDLIMLKESKMIMATGVCIEFN